MGVSRSQEESNKQLPPGWGHGRTGRLHSVTRGNPPANFQGSLGPLFE